MSELRTIVGNHCVVHGYHWPKPLRTVKHHIVPEYLGGPDTKDNLVLVCDTGHYNIHRLLDLLRAGKPMEGGTRTERTYAHQGFIGLLARKAAEEEKPAPTIRTKMYVICGFADFRAIHGHLPPDVRLVWLDTSDSRTWQSLVGTRGKVVNLVAGTEVSTSLDVLLRQVQAEVRVIPAPGDAKDDIDMFIRLFTHEEDG